MPDEKTPPPGGLTVSKVQPVLNAFSWLGVRIGGLPAPAAPEVVFEARGDTVVFGAVIVGPRLGFRAGAVAEALNADKVARLYALALLACARESKCTIDVPVGVATAIAQAKSGKGPTAISDTAAVAYALWERMRQALEGLSKKDVPE